MVYGNKIYYLKSEIVRPSECKRCSGKDTLSIIIAYKVHHVNFIPMWPSKKRMLLECGICGQQYNIEEGDSIFQHAYLLKEHTKAKWFHFIGLGILLLLINVFLYIIFYVK